ncbi:MAG: zinc-ribbon domain-containing protein [Betaproteobacteria bacterium]
MQAQCSQCATRIQIDDAKVPDRPFKVKCPKCGAILPLPGRGAGSDTPAAAPPPPAPAPASEPAAAPAAPPSPEAVAHLERLQHSQNDAVIALAGPAAAAIQQALTRIGYNVDSVDDVEEGARLLEQGAYEVAVTSRAPLGPGRPETLAQRMLRLSVDMRRRVFVILVGDEFRSGDGTQAWAVQADLVLHPSDAPRAESYIRATMAERKRLYQPLLDARRRLEAD